MDIPIPVESFTIDSVINLPEGLDYACSTENCEFLSGEVNCIYLSGTPTDQNTDTLYPLKIFLTVNAFLPLPVAFPDPNFAPGSYDLVLHPEGNAACETVAIRNYQSNLSEIQLFPNPATQVVNLKLENTGEIHDIKIWNQAGALVKTIQTSRTSNQISVEDLPAGFYLTTIHTDNEIYRSRFIKH
jgi:hypothetical protein